MNIKEIKKTCEIYLRYKYEYYILFKPTITDSEFDKFEQKLKDIGEPLMKEVTNLVDFPSLKQIKKLGLEPSNIVDIDEKDEAKYPHLTSMLSLEKIQVNDETNYPLKDIKLFMARSKFEYLECSGKYDGNAISLIYENGKLKQALTRGNDTVNGKDKTEKIKHIVPENISMTEHTYQIRGELVIDYELWLDKYDESEEGKVSNPRNYIGGLIGADEYNLKQIKDLTFIAYDMVAVTDDGNYPVIETMNVLNEIGFNEKYKPFLMKFHNINEFDKVYKRFKQYREECPFWLDGIVIKFPESLRIKMGFTSHHPKSMVAIKFVPNDVITKISDIEWTLGKMGDFTPVAILEPVELDGTIVRRASLHNLGYIINNKVFPGAVVSIAKKGEIIPQIVGILEVSPNSKEYLIQYDDFLNNQ